MSAFQATVSFFAPSTTLENVVSGGTLQSFNPSKSWERAQGLDKDGDEAASKTHGARSAGAAVFKFFAASGSISLPAPGTVTTDGWHIDSFSLRLSNADWPELTLQVHKHEGTRGSHNVGSCRTYTPTLTVTAGFGIVMNSGAIAGTGFTLSPADTIGVTSLEYGMSVTHLDENGSDGDWLAGENRDGVETLTIQTVGKGAVTAPSGWDQTSDNKTDSNQAADTESWEFVHHVQKDGDGSGSGT